LFGSHWKAPAAVDLPSVPEAGRRWLVRIALFSEVFPPKIDGITTRLAATLPELLKLGHEVTLFAPSQAGDFPGVRVVRVPSLAFRPYPGVAAGLPDPRITARLAWERPDVVHVVGPVCLGAWGTLAARALGLPLVASFHTDLVRYATGYRLGFAKGALAAWLRTLHGLAHVNLCPSSATRHELLEQGIPRVGLWRGGVDAERFHPSKRSLPMRARLSEGRPDQPLLLYVGRLAREKSIESLAWLLDALPEARLALVGDGPDRKRLERVFAKQPVHFAGFLAGDELAAAFASADVFVMPSRTETLGFVALEAMASGVPVVAADAGGLRDVVQHGENGLLYDPCERKGALAPIHRLFASRGLGLELARMGRKTAENASWEAETRRLVSAYERARARVRRPSRRGHSSSVPCSAARTGDHAGP
jgi:glycosyltransferase involved in cell wall biosynthesis